jgi:hypothetical protein
MADLVTEAEVTAAWPGFDTLDDGEKAALISAASAAIERYCRRTFEEDEVTERFDGNGRPRVWLSRRPVASVASVVANGETLTAEDYSFNPETGELFRGDGRTEPRHVMGFPRGTRNITVTYTGGYATVPEDVKRATLVLVRHVSDGTAKTGVLSSESLGEYSYVLNTAFSKAEMPPLAAMLLAPFVQDDIV